MQFFQISTFDSTTDSLERDIFCILSLILEGHQCCAITFLTIQGRPSFTPKSSLRRFFRGPSHSYPSTCTRWSKYIDQKKIPWGLPVPLHCATFAGPFAGPLAGPLASASAATCSLCPLGGKYVRVFPQDCHVVPLSPITYIIYPK